MLNKIKVYKIKRKNRQLRRYAEKAVETAIFEASGPYGFYFEKTKIQHLDMVKGVYQITGLYRFSFGQEVLYKPTDTFTSENKNILDRLLASHGF